MIRDKQLVMTIATVTAVIALSIALPDTADAIFRRPRRTAPEVDPGTVGNAIALAFGGLAILRNKLRRR